MKARFYRGQVVADTRLDGCYVRIVKQVEVAGTVEYEVVQRMIDGFVKTEHVSQVAEFLLRPQSQREAGSLPPAPRAKGAHPQSN